MSLINFLHLLPVYRPQRPPCLIVGSESLFPHLYTLQAPALNACIFQPIVFVFSSKKRPYYFGVLLLTIMNVSDALIMTLSTLREFSRFFCSVQAQQLLAIDP